MTCSSQRAAGRSRTAPTVPRRTIRTAGGHRGLPCKTYLRETTPHAMGVPGRAWNHRGGSAWGRHAEGQAAEGGHRDAGSRDWWGVGVPGPLLRAGLSG